MSRIQAGMHPGATWRKCDFQVHTPRDTQWDGPQIPAGDEAGRRARIDWAKTLILAAVAKGLGAIAITDHHDLAMTAYAREALAELQADGRAVGFWLYPGMEITCDDHAQCIILFAPDTPTETMERIFGLFRNVQRPADADGRLANTSLCGRDISDLMKMVLEDTFIEPVSILLPHGGDPGAHKSVIKEGFHERFRNLPCDGFYCETSHQSLNRKTLGKLTGFFPQWGSRRRGLLPTGDNRKADFGMLGAHGCWVRLGEPTPEAIRQSLLADEARIAYELPDIPAQRIIRLEIGSTLCGPSLTILLNDGLTALVGGRGSGKSALIEYLMFGIGRSALDVQQTGGEISRGATLLKTTLSGGFVRVVLERGSGEEVWQRTIHDHEKITVRRVDGSEERISPAEAQRRFQARGYRQKELSTTVSNTRSAAEQITGIAAAELIDERRANDARIDAAKLEVTTAVSKLAQSWNAQAVVERCRAKVDDLRRRYDSLAAKLKEAGLSPDAQADMERSPSYVRAEAYLAEMGQAITRSQERLRAAMEDMLTTVAPPALPEEDDFRPIREVQTLAANASAEIIGSVEQAHTALARFRVSLDAAKAEFDTANEIFSARVQAAKEQQREHAAMLQAARDLNKEIEVAEMELRQAQQKAKEMEGASATFREALRLLDQAINEKADILGQAAARTNEKSAGALRASVTRTPVSDARQAALLGLLEGSRVRGPQERIEEMVDAWQDKEAEWAAACERVISVFEMKARLQPSGQDAIALSDAEKEAAQGILGIPLTDTGAGVVWQRLDGAVVTKMLVALPDLAIEFEYRDVADYMPFVKASPGQQAAALLRLLLAQEAGTLVIDQPEDDLDNKVIMDIVAMLRTTKRKRQLIFATHNPNFVVNGDADKTVILKSGAEPSTDHAAQPAGTVTPRVSIEIDGAIETEGIRDAITELMEGRHSNCEAANTRSDVDGIRLPMCRSLRFRSFRCRFDEGDPAGDSTADPASASPGQPTTGPRATRLCPVRPTPPRWRAGWCAPLPGLRRSPGAGPERGCGPSQFAPRSQRYCRHGGCRDWPGSPASPHAPWPQPAQLSSGR